MSQHESSAEPDPAKFPPSPPVPGGEGEEELAHLDDAVIGRAFRVSAIAFVAIVAVVVGVVVYLKRKPAPAPTKVTSIQAPKAAERVATIPQTRFTDITTVAGIKFAHNNGTYGDKLLPETMGS